MFEYCMKESGCFIIQIKDQLLSEEDFNEIIKNLKDERDLISIEHSENLFNAVDIDDLTLQRLELKHSRVGELEITEDEIFSLEKKKFVKLYNIHDLTLLNPELIKKYNDPFSIKIFSNWTDVKF